MAFTTMVFKNPNTGAMKEAPVGFSWTVFFFGFFPPLFRADWKWAVITFLLGMITFGFSNIIFCFIYNKLYIRDLINAGYKAKSVANGDMSFAVSKIGMDVPQLEAA